MAELKVVISDPKSGKSVQKVLTDEDAKSLYGRKISEKINGELLNLTGYEFEITGGSDYCGFPMRRDINGPMRKAVLITRGWGLRHERRGIKRRISFAGNTVFDKTAQLNLKVVKMGKTPLFEEKAAAEGEEAKPEEKKDKKKK